MRLRDGHLAWINTVERECGLDTLNARDVPQVGVCVTQRYGARAATYRKVLAGDAAAEAALSPETLIAIQSRLIGLGFMTGQADGVFGAASRQAIRAFKQTLGHPPGDFLDQQERTALLRERPVEARREPVPGQAPRALKYEPGAPGYGAAQVPPFDPRAGVPGMLMGLLGGAPLRAMVPAPAPDLGRAPGIVPPPPAEDGQLGSQSGFSPPGALLGRPGGGAERGSLDAEFSETGTARVESPLIQRPSQLAEPGVRTVETKGTGDSADAARKDAARLAIQQVVGVFVDNRRRIELNVSDAKVSQVVNEKLISYTNAYVSKIDIVRMEQKDGLFEVTAKVGVAVGPLLKVLQDNAVPTVSFDTASAASAVETLGDEKRGALELYNDLLDKADNLMKVGIGQPQVDPSLASGPDEAWLRVPLTYSPNDDAAREWRTKFDLFAQQRAEVFIPIGQLRSQQSCDFPVLAGGFGAFSDRRKVGFIAEQPPSQQEGVAACFSSYGTPGGVMAECLGRTFVNDRRGDQCRPGKPCLRFRQRAAQVRLVVELLDANNDVIYALRNPFQNFPAIALGSSRREPQGQENGFFNFCLPSQTPFFATASRDSGAQFGDVLVFPPKGSRIRGYLNLRLPNSVITRIASVRARITKDSS
jgi:hypothetical protein